MKPEDWIKMKDRLPINGDRILTCTNNGEYYTVHVCERSILSNSDFWMPIVPPPKPDPFEKWWWYKVNSSAFENDVKEVCRRAWDAAIKSKEQGE